MSETHTQRTFLNHLLQSVLLEPDEADIRVETEDGRRGPRAHIELLPSDDDRDRLEANDGQLTHAIATALDAFGSKHKVRATFELADLDGDDYEDDPDDDESENDPDDDESEDDAS